ncbi:MAG: endonuclease/exonuclease/phosphatase family protein [Treponema sp.]|nr:endonuclease/exonuclease/phosphatase family protein [Treponema sp.]
MKNHLAKNMLHVLKAIGAVILAVVCVCVLFILFLTVVEYRPKETETLDIAANTSRKVALGEPITVMTWNIGYGALGDNADFFMDGGTMVRTASRARVHENLAGIVEAIRTVAPDVLFLQEVDLASSRSHKIDEVAYMRDAVQPYASSFANNYKVAYVPYPVPPLGKVDSGVLLMSAFGITSSERVQLPISFSWPVRVANLKRCLIVSRVPVADSNKELVLINLHLEAYDEGEGKIAQTALFKNVVQKEIDAGNYVIAGGDFNQLFSNVDASRYPTQEGKWRAGEIDVASFSDDVRFFMDADVPSCRSLDQPYKDANKSSFQYYVIDGFVVSANVAVTSCKTQDLGFVYSDHNPLVMEVTLAIE